MIESYDTAIYAEHLAALLEVRAALDDCCSLQVEQWTMLVDYARRGAEANQLSPLSRETYVELLKAFAALLERCKPSDKFHGYYQSNLSLPWSATATGGEHVRQAVEDTICRVEQAAPERSFTPSFCVRNVEVALREEMFRNSDDIDQALRPFSLTLWRVAARGYYARTGSPVRRSCTVEPQTQLLPPSEVDGVRLAAQLTDDNDLSLLLKLPTPLGVAGVWHPLQLYPVISEFRQMLAHPLECVPGNDWNRRYFYAYVRGNDCERYYWRGRPHGITIGVTADQWRKIQDLFDAAFAKPELARTWARLSSEYGEI